MGDLGQVREWVVLSSADLVLSELRDVLGELLAVPGLDPVEHQVHTRGNLFAVS